MLGTQDQPALGLGKLFLLPSPTQVKYHFSRPGKLFSRNSRAVRQSHANANEPDSIVRGKCILITGEEVLVSVRRCPTLLHNLQIKTWVGQSLSTVHSVSIPRPH